MKLDENRSFTNDGPIWTTAGGAAGLDLSLAFIESDLRAEVGSHPGRADLGA
jgi:transcriptional regulator GlxA family with amidase domain